MWRSTDSHAERFGLGLAPTVLSDIRPWCPADFDLDTCLVDRGGKRHSIEIPIAAHGRFPQLPDGEARYAAGGACRENADGHTYGETEGQESALSE